MGFETARLQDYKRGIERAKRRGSHLGAQPFWYENPGLQDGGAWSTQNGMKHKTFPKDVEFWVQNKDET
jgi:hypothetical protein